MMELGAQKLRGKPCTISQEEEEEEEEDEEEEEEEDGPGVACSHRDDGRDGWMVDRLS